MDKFNHNWKDLLIDKYYHPVEYRNHEALQTGLIHHFDLLKNDNVYILSTDDNDGRIVTLNEACDFVLNSYFAIFVINPSSTAFYLKTEVVNGRGEEFIGKI